MAYILVVLLVVVAATVIGARCSRAGPVSVGKKGWVANTGFLRTCPVSGRSWCRTRIPVDGSRLLYHRAVLGVVVARRVCLSTAAIRVR